MLLCIVEIGTLIWHLRHENDWARRRDTEMEMDLNLGGRLVHLSVRDGACKTV